MAQHLLHIEEIDEGFVQFKLTCEHPTPLYPDVAPEWGCWRDGGAEGICWLQTWWQELRNELIGKIKAPFIWPLPIAVEGNGDSTSLVKDEDAIEWRFVATVQGTERADGQPLPEPSPSPSLYGAELDGTYQPEESHS